jgi:hypothetical protein
MRKLTSGALSAVALAVAIAGCGGGGSYANDPRPPAPVTVTAAIRPEGVIISPARIGAGPIVLLATNETSRSQTLTVSQNTSKTSAAADSTGPINPQGVGQLKVDVVEGHYTIKASQSSVRPAILRVGRQRPSGQNDLLQP